LAKKLVCLILAVAALAVAYFPSLGLVHELDPMGPNGLLVFSVQISVVVILLIVVYFLLRRKA
jgi:hypothetical protein